MSKRVYTPNTKANSALDKALSGLYLLKTIVDHGSKEDVKSKIDEIRSLLLDVKNFV